MQESFVIAIDLDGTLLSSEHVISTTNRSILRQVIDLGHHVLIATGRPLRTAVEYHRQLALTTPLITLNGAAVWQPDGQTLLTEHVIESEVVDRIIQLAMSFHGFPLLAEVKEKCYQIPFQPTQEWTQPMIDFFEKAILDEPLGQKPIPWHVGESLPFATSSLLISVPREQHADFFTAVASLHLDHVYCRAWHEPHNVIEIMARGVSKATALRDVCERNGWQHKRIIAFGDEMNDVDMLKSADFGIAMKNANPSLVPFADAITKSNDEHGVGTYLMSHVIMQQTNPLQRRA